MNKTLMDKLSKLHNAKPAEIAVGYVDISVSRFLEEHPDRY
jgi:hypothetical protein